MYRILEIICTRNCCCSSRNLFYQLNEENININQGAEMNESYPENAYMLRRKETLTLLFIIVIIIIIDIKRR